jgi:LacI family transcriptional regulator
VDVGSETAGRPARPGRGRPTMKDVAAHAGVALKTVSRVVNGEPGVAPETAGRVNAAIGELGFRRNDGARLLRTGQTSSVGLILEDIGDPFYSALSRSVEDVTRRHGSLLLLGSSDEMPDRERELALAFCARRVDGLVIVPAGTDHQYLAPEIEAGTAAVFVDRPPGLLNADAVLTANEDGARAGVAHLIRQGHRRVGYLGDAAGIYTAGMRHRGYRAAMSAAGLDVEDSWVTQAPPDPAGVRQALTRMLAGPAPVTALFCGNNRVTVLVLRELAAARRHAPADRAPAAAADRLALVGFDDFELAELVTPAITVVAQDPAEMGRLAADLLFRRLGGEHGPAQTIMLSTTLIPRGSGERPPGDPG